MLEVELRNVLESDLESAYEIFKQMHEKLCYSDINPDWEIPRKPLISDFDTFKETLDNTNIFFVDLKGDENKTVGYIILNVYTSGSASIQEIMIKPEERRKGYGRRSLKKLIEVLKEDDEIATVKVISATMATDNFYSSCNFRYTSGDLYEYRLR